MLKTAGAVFALPTLSARAVAGAPPDRSRAEGRDTPKISLEGGLAGGITPEAAAAARGIKQLGVNNVLSGGPRIPWDETGLKGMMDRLQSNGLTLGNLMISGFNNAVSVRVRIGDGFV